MHQQGGGSRALRGARGRHLTFESHLNRQCWNPHGTPSVMEQCVFQDSCQFGDDNLFPPSSLFTSGFSCKSLKDS